MKNLFTLVVASALSMGSAQAALTLLSDPTSATVSSEFNSSFAVGNLFDGTPTLADVGSNSQNGADYAGFSIGPHVVVYDMGSSIELAGVFYAQRVSTLDAVNTIEFWVEAADPGVASSVNIASLGAADHILTPTNTANNNLTEYDFGGAVGTGQFVVMRLTGSAFNPGGGELQLAETAAVPEPSSTALLGLGGLALLLRRKK